MTVQSPPGPVTRESDWASLIVFGAVMMFLVGAFSVVEGLTALFDDQYYVTSPHGALLFDLTGWGWIHFIMGIIAVLTGLGLLAKAWWARYPAVALAALSAVAHLAFLPAAPFWAIIVLTLDVLVIWALIAHGDDALSRRS
ncbi:hypothetical protein [Amycolatopsis sp. NPDC051903]|uniref:DUF7144 family membrane protein n=1 Tax=Amycolatopsis sp. NPDC051903 TaxID=3363936 RepID=UPI0037AF3FBD